MENAKAKALCNKPCQPKGHPCRICAWEEEAAGCISSSLILPKLDLSKLKFVLFQSNECKYFCFPGGKHSDHDFERCL